MILHWLSIGAILLKMTQSPAPPAWRPIEMTVRGLRLAAKAWGSPQGHPVVGLHGWLDNASTFDALAPLLPELQLVALDCPGHGWSDPVPPAASYHFTEWLPLPFEVADALGWERFSLLGHSMGAAIASLAAGLCPERLHRVVLLDALGPFTSRAEQAPADYRRYWERLPHVGRPLAIYKNLELAALRLTQAVAGLSLGGARTLVARGMRLARPGDRARSAELEPPPGFVWRSDPRLRLPSAVRWTEPQVQAFLREVTCPCLLIEAEEGLLGQVDALLGARAACIAELRRERLAGGHHLHLDRPGVVAPLLRTFFGLDPLASTTVLEAPRRPV